MLRVASIGLTLLIKQTTKNTGSASNANGSSNNHRRNKGIHRRKLRLLRQ